jgi:LysM repeat protein
MLRTRQMSLVLTLVIIAVLLAIATFVAIVLISNRPDPTAATATIVGVPIAQAPPGQVVVEGMTVVLDPDPNQSVYILGEGPPPGQDGLVLPPAAVDPSLQVPPATATAPLPGDPLLPTATLPAPIIEQPVATPIPAATIAPTRDPNPVIIIRYTVQPGDSLYSIADAQNSSIELMALYDIADDHLVPGNVLNLPVANPAYCPGRRAYVVRDIDTLFRIATIFNTTVDQLRSINGIADDNIIEVTQVICVP